LTVSLILPALSYGMDLELGWDANAEPDIAGYSIYYKAASSGAPYSGTGADQGPSPIQVPLASLADSSSPGYKITGLTDGEVYYLVVTAYDTEGLESAYSKEAAIPRIVSPIEGFYVTRSDCTSYTVSGTSAALADVEIFANGHSLGYTTAEENGFWSATADFTSAGEGAISLTVTSTGATSDALQGTFDKTGPTVAVSYDKPGPYRDADMVTVTATLTDAGSIAGTPQIAIDFAGDGSDIYATDMAATGDNKVWTYSMDVPGENEGIATIAIIAFDAVGNEVGAHSGESFTVDNTAPVIVGLSDDPVPRKSKIWSWDGADASAITFRYLIDQNGTWPEPSGAYSDVKTASKSDGDGAWYFHVQARDAAGNESEVVTVSALLDNSAPVGTVSGVPESLSNQTGLTLTIGGDGITYYKYSVDGGNYSAEIPVETGITLSDLGDGTHTISLLCRDAAGNWQTEATTVTWVVDTAAPIATLSGEPVSPSNQDSATLTVGGDEVTHYRYRLDGENYSSEIAVEEGIVLSYLGDGSHTLAVVGRDEAGKWQTEPTAATWTVDTHAPAASFDYSPTHPTNQEVLVTLKPSEAVSLTNNGGAITRTFTENGTFVFEFVDAAGNMGSATAEVTNIDRTPPTATVIYSNTDPINQDVVATIDPSEPVTVSNNGGSISYTFTSSGSFTFEFVDTAGNEGFAVAVANWIDKTAPAVTGLSDDPGPVRSKTWRWETDEPAKFRYAIDRNAEWVSPAGEFKGTTSASIAEGDGTFYFHVQALDGAGNRSGVVTVSVLLDNTPPLALISGAPQSPTNKTGAVCTLSGQGVTQ